MLCPKFVLHIWGFVFCCPLIYYLHSIQASLVKEINKTSFVTSLTTLKLTAEAQLDIFAVDLSVFRSLIYLEIAYYKIDQSENNKSADGTGIGNGSEDRQSSGLKEMADTDINTNCTIGTNSKNDNNERRVYLSDFLKNAPPTLSHLSLDIRPSTYHDFLRHHLRGFIPTCSIVKLDFFIFQNRSQITNVDLHIMKHLFPSLVSFKINGSSYAFEQTTAL